MSVLPIVTLNASWHDAARYAAGQPWDDGLTRVAVEAVRRASPLLAQVIPLLERVAPYVSPVAAKLEPGDFSTKELAAVGSTAQRGAGGPPGDLTAPAGVAGDVAGPTDSWNGWAGTARRSTARSPRACRCWSRRGISSPGERLPRACGPRLAAGAVHRHHACLGGRADDALLSAAASKCCITPFRARRHRGWQRIATRCGRHSPCRHAYCGQYRRRRERLGHAPFPPECGWADPAVSLRILDEVDHMLVECLEGQAVELGWVRDNELTVRTEVHLRLVLKKTAWYSFIHPMRIGALVANGDDWKLDRFDRFGFLLGAAFQITDDVLNLTGDASRYGKEINGDLFEGKRTIVLAHALGKVNATDRAWNRKLSEPSPRAPIDLRSPAATTDPGEHRQYRVGQQSAVAFAEAAKWEFEEKAFVGVPASPDLEWLRKSVDFIVQRNA